MDRWDETWHRLRDWTNGQGQSERLAAQVLMSEGYRDIDPSHPLGGKDGGKDGVCSFGGERWIMAVYFPRGCRRFPVIKKKFLSDLESARSNQVQGFVFVTNQEIALSERSVLSRCWDGKINIFHLERLALILDRPDMHAVRRQFLAIDFEGQARGGQGGDATASDGGVALGGMGGHAGPLGSGGSGGRAVANGAGSWALGGPGGRGGVGPGQSGGDAVTPTIPGALFSLVAGGEGGGAPQLDGRGGRGGLPFPYWLDSRMPRLQDGRYPGSGGRGGNAPQYEAKLATMRRLLREYYNSEIPVSDPDYNSAVPLCWINMRLEQMQTAWRVRVCDGDFEFYDVAVLSPPVEHIFHSGVASGSSREPAEVQVAPAGVALICASDISWGSVEVQSRSVARTIKNTIDAIDFDLLPCSHGPFYVYILLSGYGVVDFILRLEGPNNEVLIEN